MVAGEECVLFEDGVSLENRRSSPVTAWETEVGTLHDAERWLLGVEASDDVGVSSW
jgi:hypothetical protein